MEQAWAERLEKASKIKATIRQTENLFPQNPKSRCKTLHLLKLTMLRNISMQPKFHTYAPCDVHRNGYQQRRGPEGRKCCKRGASQPNEYRNDRNKQRHHFWCPNSKPLSTVGTPKAKWCQLPHSLPECNLCATTSTDHRTSPTGCSCVFHESNGRIAKNILFTTHCRNSRTYAAGKTAADTTRRS